MKRYGWLASAGVLAAIHGLAFVAGSNLVESAASRVDQAREKDRVDAVRHITAGVQTWFTDAEATLRAVAQRLEPWGGSPTQVTEGSRTLAAALAGDSVIDRGAVLADLGGRVLGGTPDHAALFAHPRPYLIGPGPAVSDVIVEPLEHLQAVVFMVPLHGSDGRPRGHLAGYTAIPGGSLSARISALTANAAAGTVVISPGGVVFRSGGASSTVERAGDDLWPPAAQAAGGPGLLRYSGEGGSDRAASFAPLPNGWTVVRPVDPQELTESRRSALSVATPLLAGLLLFAWATTVGADARRRRATARSLEQARSFLAVAGHELRTPLTLVRGFSNTLTRRWDQMNPAARQDALGTLARQSQTLEQVLTRVLLASQVDAGILPDVSGPPVDAGDVVTGVARHFEEVSPLHTFELQIEPGFDVRIDSKILEHVMANLIENAVKFSPAGGRVGVTSGGSRRTVHISVEDEGIGLPTKTSDLFRRFGQREAVATRTYEEGGLGLGLFIVKSLVELAGGRVRAEARRPRGARFVLELPRCRARRPPAVRRGTPRHTPTKEPVSAK